MEKSIGLEKARLVGLTREVKNLKLRIEKLETTLAAVTERLVAIEHQRAEQK